MIYIKKVYKIIILKINKKIKMLIKMKVKKKNLKK